MESFLVPDSKTEQSRQLRLDLWNRIVGEQFDLSYYIPGITWTDTEHMAVFERAEMYSRLLKRKDDEKEMMKKAQEEAKKARSS